MKKFLEILDKFIQNDYVKKVSHINNSFNYDMESSASS